MKKEKLTSYQIVSIVFLSIFSLLILYPFVYIVAVSLSAKMPVMQGKVWLWPIGTNLKAYNEIIHYDNFLNSYWNSIKYTFTGTALALVINLLTAYPLSKGYLRGRRAFNLYFVFTMMFGGGLIASYMNLKSFGLTGTIWAVLLPACCNAYYLILTRTFFEQVPIEMEESAKIDGANDMTIFSKIYLPVSKPIISTMILFFAVERWNSWFSEYIYLPRKEQFPLQLVLRQIVIAGQMDAGAAALSDEKLLSTSLKYSSIVLAVLPMLIIYPLLQKYLVKGIMLGAVKG
ncbi:MAG: carbohydrate ABC transporter permease [Oscillospiraceae bacterium]|nr:carbohydrate ABC transporter permease [Oscillospiraceae bacterium]